MAKLVLMFITIFIMFYVGIQTYQQMSSYDRYSMFKTILFSLVCSILSISTMALIVIAF